MIGTMLRFIISHCRQNIYFIIGLTVGVSVSLILSPVLENECDSSISAGYFTDRLTGGWQSASDMETDEYKPRINLAGKPQKAQKTPQTLVRPRYYSTELGIREKLFIAVLTSQSTIFSNAVSVNRTVAHLVDKIMYFIDALGPQKLNITMPGIVGFTDTRRILKPFHMLKYITDNHLEDYDYFFLMRDSTYLKARKLRDTVQSISVSEDVHAGSGKNDEHTAFCSLDAGLLLSNSVLRKVLANMEWCVKNAFSDSDDANVGRCIVHASGLSCQDSVQGQKFTSFELNSNMDIRKNFDKLQQDQLFESSLTIYPVSEALAYKLHSYFCKSSLNDVVNKIDALRHSMTNKSHTLVPITWPVGNQPGNIPSTRFDVLRWDYFTEKLMYLGSDFTNVKQLTGADKRDIEYVLKAAVLKIENLYNGQLVFRKLINGYRRFDQSRGMDYRLDMAFKSTTTGREVHKRIEVCKALGKVEIIPMPYVTENTRVNLILPVEADLKEEAKTFMEQYAKICMEKHDKTFLMLVLLYDAKVPGKGNKDDVFLDVKNMALALSDKYKKDGGKIAWVSIKVPAPIQTGVVLHSGSLIDFAVVDLVVKKLPPDSLILLCQPNMEIRQDYLNRVRMNTVLQWQVFSPIPFTEFHPDIVYTPEVQRAVELDINKNYGHYDSFSKSNLAFYAKDYLAVRRQVEHIIPTVQNDRDINSLVTTRNRTFVGSDFSYGCSINSLYSMFVCASNYHVLRAVEPGLRIRHRERNCSVLYGLQLLQDCEQQRAFNLGHRSQLAHAILEYKTGHTL
ncbi:chondroitin sulfate synthase 2 [Schistocerca americana]|uniref:chondroitin sulfate synthase 2 n=1 Tax=Schistocerca americana TaxID=7009 RepID=UPI001F4F8DCF|nr:chondroitin sulfate synthase 2 [Schistocerca americana]XP_049953003.1 chondroitin sulfate synthase 2 [Schistocerca serialis cubense]